MSANDLSQILSQPGGYEHPSLIDEERIRDSLLMFEDQHPDKNLEPQHWGKGFFPKGKPGSQLQYPHQSINPKAAIFCSPDISTSRTKVRAIKGPSESSPPLTSSTSMAKTERARKVKLAAQNVRQSKQKLPLISMINEGEKGYEKSPIEIDGIRRPNKVAKLSTTVHSPIHDHEGRQAQINTLGKMLYIKEAGEHSRANSSVLSPVFKYST